MFTLFPNVLHVLSNLVNIFIILLKCLHNHDNCSLRMMKTRRTRRRVIRNCKTVSTVIAQISVSFFSQVRYKKNMKISSSTTSEVSIFQIEWCRSSVVMWYHWYNCVVNETPL